MNDLDTLIKLAELDDNIEAIGTEGSQNNSTSPHDEWTDLDVTLFVKDVEKVGGKAWLKQLGEAWLVQEIPNENLFGSTSKRWQSFLAHFVGKRRVDLKFAPTEEIDTYLKDDSLNAIVWKRQDGRIPPRQTSDDTHLIKGLDEETLNEIVVEFYWSASNVIKSLQRGQLLGANEILNQHARPELLNLMSYRQALKAPFNPGANFKLLEQALDESTSKRLLLTYQQDTAEKTLASLEAAIKLFEETSEQLEQAGLILPEASALGQSKLAEWIKETAAILEEN